jgi:hypothetical protein
MHDLLQNDHGPCWVCGEPATDRCDDRHYTGHTCKRWVCTDDSVVEAQHRDTGGWDGVIIRCQEHRHLSLGTRGVMRGSGLPGLGGRQHG